MACFQPLEGYRSRDVNPSGKRSIVFDIGRGFSDLPVTLPCGRCIGCRLERSRQWAIRCVHEASLHEQNCFITLTYDDVHLPYGGSLVLKHFQDFMKRLRFHHGSGIRFFHCGEYGEKHQRPHYHAIIFNFDFPDKVLHQEKKGFKYYTSEILSDLWGFGFVIIGDVTFESSAYVARYILKKVNGEKADAHYTKMIGEYGECVDLKPEYTTMSRRPGIAAGWFDKFGSEVYPSDSVVIRGREMRPPKFYDRLFEVDNPLAFASLKAARRVGMRKAAEKHPDPRLAVREKHQQLSAAKLIRGYENED